MCPLFADSTISRRAGHPFAGFVYFWVNVAFVVAIPVLVAIDLAGLRVHCPDSQSSPSLFVSSSHHRNVSSDAWIV
eukprot:SAG31_NODE_538_length_14312_cov_12.542461_6_plen_76_part_00